MNPTMNLPEAIRQARKELGLTQDALGRLSGTSPNRISALEQHGNVTLETLRQILRQLPNLEAFTLETVTVVVKRPPMGAFRARIVAALSRLVAALR